MSGRIRLLIALLLICGIAAYVATHALSLTARKSFDEDGKRGVIFMIDELARSRVATNIGREGERAFITMTQVRSSAEAVEELRGLLCGGQSQTKIRVLRFDEALRRMYRGWHQASHYRN